MNRPATLLLALSVAFTAMFLLPPLLGYPFPPYPLMAWADVVDVFTPLVLLPLYAVLFARAPRAVSAAGMVMLAIAAAFWVEGQGMHLAANSIGHLLAQAAGTDTWSLTYFYDETLSHWLWHLGILALAAGLIWAWWEAPAESAGPIGGRVYVAGGLHGLTLFLVLVEGRTALLFLPALTVMLVGLVAQRRSVLGKNPVLSFFLAASAVALAVTAAWWLYWGRLVEICEVLGC